MNMKAEEETNKIKVDKFFGQLVQYGQKIQLRHQRSGKYLHLSLNSKLQSHFNEYHFSLVDFADEYSSFSFEMVYKHLYQQSIHVCYGDEIYIQNHSNMRMGYLNYKRFHKQLENDRELYVHKV